MFWYSRTLFWQQEISSAIVGEDFQEHRVSLHRSLWRTHCYVCELALANLSATGVCVDNLKSFLKMGARERPRGHIVAQESFQLVVP